jgi:SAM-dependent methyltransferase
MDIQGLDAYWDRGFPNIEGWVDTRLLACLSLVDAIQRGVGVQGQVGEIGVYHGKLLIALAHLAHAGGKVTAIDVFEDQTRNLDGAGIGSLDRLKQNIQAFGPADRDYAFIKADSIALTPADKGRIMEDRGPFRLFSVDGCHTAEHTVSDLLTGQDVIAPGGVVILDDFMQPHWPGVTEAVNLFYSRYVPRVKPFLYCFHKLFFVGYGWHADFLDACTEHLGARPDAKTTDMFGSRVLSIYP